MQYKDGINERSIVTTLKANATRYPQRKIHRYGRQATQTETQYACSDGCGQNTGGNVAWQPARCGQGAGVGKAVDGVLLSEHSEKPSVKLDAGAVT